MSVREYSTKYKPGQILMYEGAILIVEKVDEYTYRGRRKKKGRTVLWEDRWKWADKECKPLPLTTWTKRRYGL